MQTHSSRRGTTALAIGAAVLVAVPLLGQPSHWLDAYREPAARLVGAALADNAAWRRLAALTDTFGARLSGSPGLDAAIRWTIAEMQDDGFDNVRAEPVMVPQWIRGRESAEVLEPVVRPLVMLGLGGSVGTPPDGIVADAIVVSSFTDLESHARDVAGRIVVYNVPYTGYGQTVQYRGSGASRAARFGAVAVLVRSIGPLGLRTPHTGSLRYDENTAKIPAAAITAEDAAALQRLQARGQRPRVRLVMDARSGPDVPSANVVAEIVGHERPEEIVVVGGHLDSWDVGTGASDDGVGCVVTWEAARLIRAVGLRPRRTVRVVLFTNEENGLRGGLGYRDRHRDELSNHVLMLESDLGVFDVSGFGFSGTDRGRDIATQIASLLDGVRMDRIGGSGGGADIGPSVQAAGIAAMSLDVNADRYFVVHHTQADTIDHIDPMDVARAVAGVAVMAYVVADMPERLGGAEPSTR